MVEINRNDNVVHDMSWLKTATIIVGSAAPTAALVFALWHGKDTTFDYVRNELGIETIIETLDINTDGIYRNSERITNLTNEVRLIKPVETVLEIDGLRSFVTGPCSPGGWCPYQIWARRTTIGLGCDAPSSIEGWVRDRYAVEHPVELQSTSTVRLDERWTLLSNSFRFTESMPDGVAQFVITATYQDCPWSPENDYLEDTTPLPFNIVRDE